ncbi:MAG: small basic protein [Planctomycetia bacterium]|nr:small basic protein [Planctomycetia bacterium]
MSIHKSLKKVGALKRHRNVLTRSERFKTLEEDGKATEATSVFALPKIRSILVKAKAKVKEPAAGAAAPAAGAAAPAAGAAAGAKAAAPAAKGAPAAAAKPAAPAKK